MQRRLQRHQFPTKMRPKTRHCITGPVKWRSIPYNSIALEATASVLSSYGIKLARKPTSTLLDQLMKPKTSLEESE